MAKIISTSASVELPGYWHGLATDGNPSTFWNGGECNNGGVLFELILDKPVQNLTVKWIPQMSPSTGHTEIEFQLINEHGEMIGSYQKDFATTSGIENIIDFPCPGLHVFGDKRSNNFSRIRLHFIKSSSWIAIREISIL